MYKAATEAELIARSKQRDGEAFAELIQRTRPYALRAARSILRDSEEVQDQLQAAYLSAWRQIGGFREDAKFSTWITTIVVNQSLMRLRKLRRTPLTASFEFEQDGEYRSFDVADGRPLPEAEMARQELIGIVRAEMQKVPPIFRRVLTLVDLHSTPVAEAASQLGISVAAAKSRLSRARNAIRARLEARNLAGVSL
ncbi:MAG: sigma-70 family RNA polymerase sigma factor [Acidobacteria bacterium]|nr:sigma-70 family RNA polymerase sigma factor [Acidobacteriota bacterium]